MIPRGAGVSQKQIHDIVRIEGQGIYFLLPVQVVRLHLLPLIYLLFLSPNAVHVWLASMTLGTSYFLLLRQTKTNNNDTYCLLSRFPWKRSIHLY